MSSIAELQFDGGLRNRLSIATREPAPLSGMLDVPGSATAEYIDAVLSRITLPGAIFLTFIALLPIWITDAINVPFTFGGTSLLIVVGVALDTMAQMQQHLLLRKYDGFMKKGRVRFRGRGQVGGF